MLVWGVAPSPGASPAVIVVGRASAGTLNNEGGERGERGRSAS